MNRNPGIRCRCGLMLSIAAVLLWSAVLMVCLDCSSGVFDVSGNPSDIGGAQEAQVSDTLFVPDSVEIYDIFEGGTFGDSYGGLSK
jgi:hypothetical protein